MSCLVFLTYRPHGHMCKLADTADLFKEVDLKKKMDSCYSTSLIKIICQCEKTQTLTRQSSKAQQKLPLLDKRTVWRIWKRYDMWNIICLTTVSCSTWNHVSELAALWSESYVQQAVGVLHNRFSDLRPHETSANLWSLFRRRPKT